MLSIDEIRIKARQWLGPEFNEETRKEVREMLENDEKKLIDAFYQDLEFGTGGLRGIMGAGTNRMNIYTLGMATQGLSNYIIKECGNVGIKVLSPMIAGITAGTLPRQLPISFLQTDLKYTFLKLSDPPRNYHLQSDNINVRVEWLSLLHIIRLNTMDIRLTGTMEDRLLHPMMKQ